MSRNAIPSLVGLLVFMVWLPRAHADDPLPPWSRAYNPARDPAADGRAALTLARRTQRRVLIEVGGNWCVWCRKLDHFLKTHPDLERQLHGQFVLLKVNVSEENDNAGFMAGLPEPLGYPHVYVSDANGRILHSQDTAEWLENGRYSAAHFRAFLDRWRSDAQATTRD